jgi:glutamate racemase
MTKAENFVPVVGVFDSGVGGLTVLKELVRLAPAANYLYFGDTARLPYGSKSAAMVAKYAVSAARFLEREGAGMLVVACNTATALAFDEIKQSISIPAIGVVEPGAESAAHASHSKCVAVIATEGTIASHAYQRALRARGIDAVEKACPLFVPLVEEGWVDHAVTRQVAEIYLKELFTNGAHAADTLLLGCTHYPLLRPLLQQIVPKGITIVDSAESTARAVAEQLARLAGSPSSGKERRKDGATANDPSSGKERRKDGPKGELHFFATDSVEKFRRLGERFMGHELRNVKHVEIEV